MLLPTQQLIATLDYKHSMICNTVAVDSGLKAVEYLVAEHRVWDSRHKLSFMLLQV